MKQRNIVIVMCRCSLQRQTFGMRLERTSPNVWSMTWAFPIKETAAKREGYDKVTVQGEFINSPAYPGCPYCRSPAFFRCGNCATIGCWDGQSTQVTCPGCNQTSRLQGTISSLDAGGDR